MEQSILTTITKSMGRKSLYHFTRVSNLPVIAHLDSLLSSYLLYPHEIGERRLQPREVQVQDYTVTINSHLRIPEMMIDPSCTLEQFRANLDRHVFLWPTIRDCKKMLETYTRREPEGAFAILEFDAYTLLSDHYPKVKLSKYDSGSSPRFPKHCTYRKSPQMYVPLSDFQKRTDPIYPSKSSEIKEVLIEDQLMGLSKHLKAIYVDDCKMVPMCWKELARSLERFRI
ncbi:hypothetical protein NV379_03130 [Paenibacillus sp. N1-5-1-14]|uniref:DUF7002 family protein n=1 Tax=Paenibacillus radicibacter TaxID=2972488 RepID=UPI002159498D|nr:hypothetical protein [Paenibacillus radicibacter]MCR8641641.1 hypothetical protein [Paenibacillus radicibacter]